MNGLAKLIMSDLQNIVTATVEQRRMYLADKVGGVGGGGKALFHAYLPPVPSLPNPQCFSL